MSKILVINPYITDFKLYDEWMHPLGLYVLISLLIKNNHQVYYFNCLQHSGNERKKKYGTGFFSSVEIEKPHLYKDIFRKYKRYGCESDIFNDYLNTIPVPDLICIGSMMTYWAPGVIYTAEMIRNVFPDIPIIIGGIAAQLIPQYFQKRISNCKVSGPLINISSDHALYPFINNTHFETFIDAYSILDKQRHGALLLSLGCPLRCSYCASKILQPKFYQRSIDTVIDEINYLYTRLSVRDFAFCDDALLYNPESTFFPVLDFIKKNKLQLRFHTPNGLHLNLINERIISYFKDAGFETLRFGYESGAQKYKQDTSEKIDKYDIEEKIRIIKLGGFKKSQIGIYIMAGLKNQLPKEVLSEMEYISSLGVAVKPVFLSPVPYTGLYNDYALSFPELTSDPLWHNDSFFITRLPNWDHDAVEEIRLKARALNFKENT